jgi:Protein of unknown function (DUF3617)
MTRRTVHAITAILLGMTPVTWAQVISVRPGRYETTAEMQFPGAPTPMRIKDFDCVTPEEGRDLIKAWLKEAGGSEECKLSNVKQAGNTVMFESTCLVEGERAKATAEVTFGADWFNGNLAMTVEGDRVSVKTTAKWVGPACKEEDK